MNNDVIKESRTDIVRSAVSLLVIDPGALVCLKVFIIKTMKRGIKHNSHKKTRLLTYPEKEPKYFMGQTSGDIRVTLNAEDLNKFVRNLRKHCLSLLKKTHIVPSFRRIFFINSFEIELTQQQE
ncbi:hypothetical protein ACI3LX_000397, partial [Candidozyma auris]